MPHVKLHMFSIKDQTPIYNTVHTSKIKAFVPKGSWIGVIKKESDKYQVICAEGTGWIRSSDVQSSKGYDLKISRDAKGNIQYAI